MEKFNQSIFPELIIRKILKYSNPLSLSEKLRWFRKRKPRIWHLERMRATTYRIYGSLSERSQVGWNLFNISDFLMQWFSFLSFFLFSFFLYFFLFSFYILEKIIFYFVKDYEVCFERVPVLFWIYEIRPRMVCFFFSLEKMTSFAWWGLG